MKKDKDSAKYYYLASTLAKSRHPSFQEIHLSINNAYAYGVITSWIANALNLFPELYDDQETFELVWKIMKNKNSELDIFQERQKLAISIWQLILSRDKLKT